MVILLNYQGVSWQYLLDGYLMNTSSFVQKVWSFCHPLRDDGVGYGDYLEQLTYLLFLKLASFREVAAGLSN